MTKHPSHTVYTDGFYRGDRDFTVRSLLGRAARAGSDVGEVLATISGVGEKDDRGWFEAWLALGQRVTAIADVSAAGGRRVSAARAYLRAANYLAVATEAAAAEPGEDELASTFRAHRAAWEGFVDNTRWDAQRLALPYDGTELPGWFFRPDDSGTARPTLVVVNGSDGSVSGVWCEAAEGALDRGYNVLLFDGPGQQSTLFERGMHFRPDWEAVLTPIVDVLVAREDVDAARLAVYGISQAGYWVPRALAFEHRFAAAIADPGVVDVSASWRPHIPHSILAAYDRGENAKFDREMGFGMKLPGQTDARSAWAFRARPYGTAGYAETLDAVAQYALGSLTSAIATPLLVTEPEGEQFWPGQGRQLAERVADAALLSFDADEGASMHCQPLARELTEQRIFDWLDATLNR
jgi:hypothetical protein